MAPMSELSFLKERQSSFLDVVCKEMKHPCSADFTISNSSWKKVLSSFLKGLLYGIQTRLTPTKLSLVLCAPQKKKKNYVHRFPLSICNGTLEPQTLGRLAYITVQVCIYWEKKSFQQCNGNNDSIQKTMLKTTFSNCHGVENSTMLWC